MHPFGHETANSSEAGDRGQLPATSHRAAPERWWNPALEQSPLQDSLDRINRTHCPSGI